ncbi:unnamed protein product [Rotaria sp. Silwood1]|nr:unnamed protein product [Rotaria sp. Silwood1]
MQLFNFSSKEYSRPSSILSRQLSNVESSISNTLINDNIENYTSYQRSLSIDNSIVDDLLIRTNRAISVEPNLISSNNDIKINNGHNYHYLCQQRSLPNESINSYDSIGIMNRQYTSSETIDQSIKSSPNIMMNSISNYDRMNDLQYSNFEENRLDKLKYFDIHETNSNRNTINFHIQSRVSSLKNGQHQQSSLDDTEYNSAFTIRRHLLHVKEDHLQLEQMKKTIEERLKVILPDDIGYALSDGVVLCHFINQIRPRSVQSIHVPSQAVPKLSLAKCRRNVENFIEASRRIGVPETRMSFTQDLKLPAYDELECPVVNVSSAALRAGSFHLAKYCDLQFKEFMLCRQEEQDPRKCIKEGKDVSLCAIDYFRKVRDTCNDTFTTYWTCLDNARDGIYVMSTEQDPRKCIKEGKDVSLCAIDYFRKVRDTCNDTFTTYWTCLDNARDGEMSFNYCKQEQKAFEQCAKDKMNLERPEPGYFSMVRMHDTKRPIPSDPFRLGSLERHPPKLEVPDPPLITQADEYPEARIGMKFGHRKPWMFEAKLWD